MLVCWEIRLKNFNVKYKMLLVKINPLTNKKR